MNKKINNTNNNPDTLKIAFDKVNAYMDEVDNQLINVVDKNYVDDAIANIDIPDVNLSEYEKIVDVNAKLALKADKTELTGLASETYVDNAIANIDIPDVNLSDYATTEYVDNAINNIDIPDVDLSEYETIANNNAKLALKADKTELVGLTTKTYVDNAIANIDIPDVDLTAYETITNNDAKLALKADKTELVGLTTKTYVDNAIANIDIPDVDLSEYETITNNNAKLDLKADKTELTSLAPKTYVDNAIANIDIPDVDLSEYEKIVDVNAKLALKADKTELAGLTTKTYVDDAIANIDIPDVNLSEYEKIVDVNAKLALKADKTELTGLASEDYVDNAIANIDIPDVDLSEYETITNNNAKLDLKADKTELTSLAPKTYVDNQLTLKADKTELAGLTTKTYVDNKVAAIPAPGIIKSTNNGIFINGRNESFFAPIGQYSVDLTTSTKIYNSEDQTTWVGAKATYSIAIGHNNSASNTSAIAIGRDNIASNTSAIAIGMNNNATSMSSVAIGRDVKVTTSYAVGLGRGIENSAVYCVAIGKYNIKLGNQLESNLKNPIFLVGNGGSDTTRSNAYVLLVDGTSTQYGVASYAADYSTQFTANSMVNKKYVDDAIAAIPGGDVDLTAYDKIVDVNAKLALKADKTELTGLASKTYVDDAIANIDIPNVDLTDYATKTYVANAIADIPPTGDGVFVADGSSYKIKKEANPVGTWSLGTDVIDMTYGLTQYSHIKYGTGGRASIGIGYQTLSSNDYAVTIASNSSNKNPNSILIGTHNNSNTGNQTITIGNQLFNTSGGGVAIGTLVRINSVSSPSVAIGTGLTVNTTQYVIGQYNVVDNSLLFALANGSSDGARFNYFTISKTTYDVTMRGVANYSDDYTSRFTNNSLVTKKYVDDAIAAIPSSGGDGVDLTEYDKIVDVNAKLALKADKTELTGLASKTYVDDAIANIDIPNVDLTDYATKTYVANAIADIPSSGDVDLTEYDKIVDVNAKLTLKADKTDLNGLTTKTYVDNVIAAIPTSPFVEENGVVMHSSTPSGSSVSYNFTGAIPQGLMGTNAMQIGRNTNASGAYSFASGWNSIAGGAYSFASGYLSQANGEYSFAIGRQARADANRGIAIGVGVVAAKYEEIVIGKNNIQTTSSTTTTTTTTQPMLIIGCGSSESNRENAMVMTNSGLTTFYKSVSYSSNVTISSNNQLVNKKYVDGAITTALANVPTTTPSTSPTYKHVENLQQTITFSNDYYDGTYYNYEYSVNNGTSFVANKLEFEITNILEAYSSGTTKFIYELQICKKSENNYITTYKHTQDVDGATPYPFAINAIFSIRKYNNYYVYENKSQTNGGTLSTYYNIPDNLPRFFNNSFEFDIRIRVRPTFASSKTSTNLRASEQLKLHLGGVSITID